MLIQIGIMRIIGILLCFLLPSFVLAQYEASDNIRLTEPQSDDIYMAAKYIDLEARVRGDVVVAGQTIKISDTITEDLISAAEDITISANIYDDVRMAGETMRVNSVIGDDLIAFGAKVFIEEGAIIKGNLTTFCGELKLDGEVLGDTRVFAANTIINGDLNGNAEINTEELHLSGSIEGRSEIVTEHLSLDPDARFYDTVTYWTSNGPAEFGQTLVDTEAIFSEDLTPEKERKTFVSRSLTSMGFWVYYILAAFVLILVFNYFFGNYFEKTSGNWDRGFLINLAYGLIYLLGVPILITIAMLLLVGIPLGLIMLGLFFISLFLGHLFMSLLLAHYLNKRNTTSWSFLTISILALAFAVIIRIFTIIPFIGWGISVVVLALAFGAFAITIWESRKRWMYNQ